MHFFREFKAFWRYLSMSVIDRNIIDFSHSDDSKITLCISDHITWDYDALREHLIVLQEKINDYLDFITSGQIYEHYDDKDKKISIKVIFCYKPVSEAVAFLTKAKTSLNKDGYDLEWIFRPIES